MTEGSAARPEQEPVATEIVSLEKAKTEPAVTETTATDGPTDSGATVEVAVPQTAVPQTEVPQTEVAQTAAPSTDAGATVVGPPAVTVETPVPASADGSEGEAATAAAAATAIVEVAPGATVEIKALDAAAGVAPEVPATVITSAITPAPAAPEVAANQLYPPYPQQGWPQQAWPQQAWPQPAAQPGPWHPPAPPPGQQRKFPMWIPITFAVVVGAALIAGVIAIVMVSVTPKPGDLASQAVTAAADWPGATYRGSVDGTRGTRTEFEVSVTGQGVRGTLTRPGGAKAEVVKDTQGTLMRGNKQWWQASRGADADKLADVWLTGTTNELSDIDTILKTDPKALVKLLNINPNLTSMWRQTADKVVDGVRLLELTDGLHRILITADAPHRLVGIDVEFDTRNDPMPTRVAALDAALVDQINRAAAQVRTSTPPKSVTQRLSERAELRVAEIKTDPVCREPSCPAVITISNAGELAGKGQVVVSVDGVQVGVHDVSLEPGKSTNFTDQVPNRFYNGAPGSQGTINVFARVIPVP